MIISDQNGEAEIMNEINTMNTLKTNNSNLEVNYSSVMSKTISKFCIENSIKKIDFLKIDIEGSELKLLNDLLDLPIKSMQVELIRDNPLDANIEFLNKLSYKYQIYNFTSHVKENVNDVIKNLDKHFKNKTTIDFFLINQDK